MTPRQTSIKPVPRVYPTSYSEDMRYLDGVRRHTQYQRRGTRNVADGSAGCCESCCLLLQLTKGQKDVEERAPIRPFRPRPDADASLVFRHYFSAEPQPDA